MEPQSPPKRMTRARAAAKASADTATIASSRAKASSKAKPTRSTATGTTASSAAKRKIRPEEAETDNEQDELGPSRAPAAMKTARGVRGRPKKAVAAAEDEAPEPAAPAARPRGRPKKTAEAVAVTVEAKEKESTARATRATASMTRATRTRKTAAVEDDGTDAAAKVTTTAKTAKTTRTRAKSSASSSTAPAVSVRTAAAAAAKTVPKKKVTFEEPEKENIAPRATAKARSTAKAAEATAGLRAKPVRRAAATTRATRTVSATRSAPSNTASGETTDKLAAPLSPKKVTQMRMARDDVESEDELGVVDGGSVYIKPLHRSPAKPSMHMGAQERIKALGHAGLDLEAVTRDMRVAEVDDAAASVLEMPGAILASPARRPPASPAKEGLMNSPARRIEGFAAPLGLDVPVSAANPAKMSLLLSPAKRFPVPTKHTGNSLEDTSRSPSKSSLLLSPAKRPASPVKAAMLLQRPDMKPTPGRTTKKASELLASPGPTSTLLASARREESEEDFEVEPDSLTQMLSEMASEAATMVPDSPSRIKFSGRLSAVAPREAEEEETEEEQEEQEEQDETILSPGEPMDVDLSTLGAAAVLLHISPPKARTAFGLRAQDLTADMSSDEEEETTSLAFAAAVPATPCPSGKRSSVRTPGGRDQSTAKRLRVSKLGFTPLAEQLSGWRAHSPEKVAEAEAEQEMADAEVEREMADLAEKVAEEAAFFEDAVNNHMEAMDEIMLSGEVLPPVFDEVLVTDEDLELAAEANDMSLLEAEAMRGLVHATPPTEDADDAMSEDGQYGDENAIPIDPVLMAESALASPGVPPVTPQRVVTRTFHTVSKVPLKAPDESTPPGAMRRRSLSVSRLPRRSLGAERNAHGNSCGLQRNATVISYSPGQGKDKQRRASRRQSRRESFGGEAAVADMVAEEESEIVQRLSNSPAPSMSPMRRPSVPATPTPTTPARSEAGWSLAGTPARTPRRDIDSALLRGAVVFVDVYTTDGSDASAIFVELLTQMGARCVKQWPWSPSGEQEEEMADDGDVPASSTSKIGITHVVFKDGAKRTLDKVRQSAGVVQCVGVSWVLDCERENEWLDEAPYSVDTSVVPRGGPRRKSMGPGMRTPAKQTDVPSKYRSCQTAPTTPGRPSMAWEGVADSPEAYGDGGDYGGDHGGDHGDYGSYMGETSPWMLTAPKTPAPETIARYAEAITPSGSVSEADDDTVMSLQDEQLLMRTCPAKRTVFHELGEGILAREKDERVLMRLMSARRKSLQFAPKIGSPLSKGWSLH